MIIIFLILSFAKMSINIYEGYNVCSTTQACIDDFAESSEQSVYLKFPVLGGSGSSLHVCDITETDDKNTIQAKMLANVLINCKPIYELYQSGIHVYINQFIISRLAIIVAESLHECQTDYVFGVWTTDEELLEHITWLHRVISVAKTTGIIANTEMIAEMFPDDSRIAIRMNKAFRYVSDIHSRTTFKAQLKK